MPLRRISWDLSIRLIRKRCDVRPKEVMSMFRRMIIRFVRGKRAQSMVEFALVMPILVFLIGGMLTGGQMLFTKLNMQMAVYEGGRIGVTQPNLSAATTEATNKVKSFLTNKSGLIQPNSVTVTTGAPSGWKKGANFTVKATYQATPIFPVPGIWNKGSSTKIEEQITMAIENGT